MNDFFLRYRLPIVTAVLALAGLARALGVGNGVLPDDAALTQLVDALGGGVAAVVWLWTYYNTDTSKGSIQENV